MEKVKNMMIMVIYYLKGNICMEINGMVRDIIKIKMLNMNKKMEMPMLKNILIGEKTWNLKDNINMDKKMEKVKSIIIIMIIFI